MCVFVRAIQFIIQSWIKITQFSVNNDMLMIIHIKLPDRSIIANENTFIVSSYINNKLISRFNDIIYAESHCENVNSLIKSPRV